MNIRALVRFGMVLSSLMAGFTNAAPWKFGIIGDTQWPAASDDGKNPNSVAVDIINQVNREVINQGVKFVIAVGNITDAGTVIALDTRATYVQALYNAGIGFYPLRGNHESSATAAAEFVRIFPQTANGINNNTPANAFVYTDSANTHPAAKTGTTFTVGTGFSSPSAALAGLSYSFTYQNATFVLLDQFTPANSSSNTIDAQQAWITNMLAERPAGTHAFVLGHKGIITENHADNLFGNTPALDSSGQNAFIRSLAANGIRYYIGGHDHMFNRALVTATNSTTRIQEIISGSDSYKFYSPARPPIDSVYDVPAFGRVRETPLRQELAHIGYSIVTVDSMRVSIDFYSVQVSPDDSGDITTTPPLTGYWKKRETFGYGLNGKEFLIAQGQSYTTMVDSLAGTIVRILGGVNSDTAKDYGNRRFSQFITTGWSTVSGLGPSGTVCSIWGMALALGTSQTTTFPLSMSYGPGFSISDLNSGKIGLLSRDSTGTWFNAVTLNKGGTPQFITGPWSSAYSLGAYGIDTSNHTAWAVINHAGDFLVAPFSITATNSPLRHRLMQHQELRLRGSTLILPESLEGHSVSVEFFNCMGRKIGRANTQGGTTLALRGIKNIDPGSLLLVRYSSGVTSISDMIVYR